MDRQDKRTGKRKSVNAAGGQAIVATGRKTALLTDGKTGSACSGWAREKQAHPRNRRVLKRTLFPHRRGESIEKTNPQPSGGGKRGLTGQKAGKSCVSRDTGETYESSHVYRKQQARGSENNPAAPQPVTSYFTIKHGFCQGKTGRSLPNGKSLFFCGLDKEGEIRYNQSEDLPERMKHNEGNYQKPL